MLASILHGPRTSFTLSRRSSDSVEIQQAPQCETLEPRLLLSAAPAGAWQTFIGGSGSEDADAVAIAGDGSIYVTGRTRTANWAQGGYDTTLEGFWDAFVAKYDADGHFIWSTYIGGSSYDLGHGIAVDDDGNVVVVGTTSSNGWISGGYDTSYADSESTNNIEDSFVVKLTANGQLLWSSYLGGRGSDIAEDVVIDHAGNIYVTGESRTWEGYDGWVSGGADTSFNGGGDAFVVKLNPAGQHVWSTYLGGEDYERAYGIAIDEARGHLIVLGNNGSQHWASGPTTVHSDESNIFVTRLTLSGQYRWTTFVGPTKYVYPFPLAVDTDAAGNIYLTGFTHSGGNWTQGGFDTTYNGGYSDAFVVKLAPNGRELWSTYLGGKGDEFAHALAVTAAGEVFVVGGCASTGTWVRGGMVTYPPGMGNVFVAKLTTDGCFEWATYLGGERSETANDIALDADDGIVLVGSTDSVTWSASGFADTAHGSSEGFLTRIPDVQASDNVWRLAYNMRTLAMHSPKAIIEDYVGPDDRKDWFRFKIDSTTQTKIVLTNRDDNADLKLYRKTSSGKLVLVDKSTRSGSATDAINRRLAAGWYYIVVTAAAGAKTYYELMARQLDTGTAASAGGVADAQYLTALASLQLQSPVSNSALDLIDRLNGNDESDDATLLARWLQ